MKALYKLSQSDRIAYLVNSGLLTANAAEYLLNSAPAECLSLADDWIENCIGAHPLPLGIVNNIPINDTQCHAVLAVEETSIIAALNKTTKWVREEGKLSTESDKILQIGQVIVPGRLTAQESKSIEENIPSWVQELNTTVAHSWHQRGGGVQNITIHSFEDFFQLHVHVNTLDAMGANRTNQICEALKQLFESQLDHTVLTCILSNHTTTCSHAQLTLDIDDPILAERIVFLNQVAKQDISRAATHNKGIMNAIEPIMIATGNDWRATSAAIHSYAARHGRYQGLTEWSYNGNQLKGRLSAPIPLGIVGGITRQHPGAQLALKIMNIKCATELAERAAALGLLQNLAALKALVTEGITPGHMRLHIDNILQDFNLSQEHAAYIKSLALDYLAQHKQMNHSIIANLIDQHQSCN